MRVGVIGIGTPSVGTPQWTVPGSYKRGCQGGSLGGDIVPLPAIVSTPPSTVGCDATSGKERGRGKGGARGAREGRGMELHEQNLSRVISRPVQDMLIVIERYGDHKN
eukprot:750756-Hanusia_phi.AAC.2